MKDQPFSIKTSLNQASNSLTIIFEGDLGIKNAEEIKNTIQTIDISGDSVTMHLKNVENLDITSIQTIMALRIFLNSKGKKTNLLLEIPQNIERLLKNTGLDKTMQKNT